MHVRNVPNRIFKLTDKTGKKYIYNEDNIFQIARAYDQARYLARYAETSDPTMLGSVYSLDPDTSFTISYFGRNYVDQFKVVDNLFEQESGTAAVNKLIALRNQTKSCLDIYYTKLAEVNRKNSAVLQKMNTYVSAAQTTRDVAGTIAIVGSSVITAPVGLAAAALTGGAAAKAYGKYTDTGNVGAASVEFVCEMGCGMLGIGAKAAGAALTTGEKVCIFLFAKIPAETAKCVASGDTFQQTLASLLLTGVFAGVSEGFGKLLEKIPIPASFKEAPSATTLKELFELIKGVGENYAEDYTKGKAKDKIAGNDKIAGKGKNKDIKFNAIKTSHINARQGSEDAFVRKYCLAPV